METKIPKSWSEVSIGQFCRLRTIPESLNPRDRGLHVIAILLGTTVSSIKKMDAMEYLKMHEDLKFASSMPDTEFRRQITIDGRDFGFLPDLSALTVAEVIDLETFGAKWDKELANLMAILYRPITKRNEDGTYDVEDYGDSRADVRAKLFDEKMSAQDAYGASIFFSLIVATCIASSRAFLDPLKIAKRMVTN